MIITIQLDVSTPEGRAALEAAMLAMAPEPIDTRTFADIGRKGAGEICGAFDSAGRAIGSIIPAAPAAPKAPTAPPKAPAAPVPPTTLARNGQHSAAPTFADLMQAIAKSGLNDKQVAAAVSRAGAASLMDAATNPALCQAVYDQVLANDLPF